MKKISLVYFGTPGFSARFLEKILTDVSINQLIDTKLVVTQPDKPVGRKQVLTPSPVKQIAKKYQISNIKYLPEMLRISKQAGQKDIRNLKLEIRNFDLALLYAYGKIIPKELLKMPKFGFWNIHPSLLPKYRGASPIAYPLILGDKKTGVTIIKMDEKMDHGPIIAQKEMNILPTDRRPDLEIKLTDLAFAMFKKLIISFCTPMNRFIEQQHTKATHTRLLKKDDGFIPIEILKKALNNEPLKTDEIPQIINEYCFKNNITIKQYNNLAIYNYFRGLYLWPGIWTMIEPPRLKNATKKPRRLNETVLKRLKITNMELVDGKLIIKKVQLEGKKEVEFQIFNRAYKIF